MERYVDFDGVVFDTEKILFDDNYYKMKLDPDFDKTQYVQNIDWYELISKSEEINNAINILRELKRTVKILTKVNSLDNEAKAKVRILRELDIKSDILLVPFNLKKTDIVDAEGNILVDDTIHNLEDWEQARGIPIFFNKDYLDLDNWDRKNTKYRKVKSLEFLLR